MFRVDMEQRDVLTLVSVSMLIQEHLKQNVPQGRLRQGILPLEHLVQAPRRVITSRSRVDGTRILVQPGSIKMLLDRQNVSSQAQVTMQMLTEKTKQNVPQVRLPAVRRSRGPPVRQHLRVITS